MRDSFNIGALKKNIPSKLGEPLNRALYTLRAIFDPFEHWNKIDKQIGLAFGLPACLKLIERRENYISTLQSRLTYKIEQACKRSPDGGWNEWVVASAKAISQFRLQFALDLSQHKFPFADSKQEAFAKIRQALPLMLQARWPEAYDALDFLTSRQSIPANTKANLYVICGQINLYHFAKLGEAKMFFQTAMKLAPDAPDQGRRISAWGDYLKGSGDVTAGKESYEEATRISPALAFGYVGLGECAESEGKFDEAENQYNRAKEAAPGDANVYQKLLKLYGRPGQLGRYEEVCKKLVEKIVVLEARDEYQAFCNLADLYSQNNRFTEAREWYRGAISSDITRPSGYMALAASYEKEAAAAETVNKKQEKLEKAAAEYRKAIDNAPNCYDGYWGLTSLHEIQSHWREALLWYENIPQWRKEWADTARAKTALMYWRLGEAEKAEALLKQDLSDRANQAALDTLDIIAGDHFRDKNQPSEALRLYNEIIKIAPDLQKPRLHRKLAALYRDLKEFAKGGNELDKALSIDNNRDADSKERMLLVNEEGNEQYTQGHYEEAIGCYRKAIALRPNDATLHANLGSALAKLAALQSEGNRSREIKSAIDAYRRAQELNPLRSYPREISTLELSLKYGDYALERIEGGVTPIFVELSDDLTEKLAPDGIHLSDELVRLIEDKRSSLKNQYGIVLPVVRFRRAGAAFGKGNYRIFIMEIRLPEVGYLPSDNKALQASLMERIDAVLRRHLWEFVGHQEVAQLVEAVDKKKLADFLQTPKKLAALVSVCRGLLIEGVGLNPFEKLLDEFEGHYLERGSLQEIVERIRARPEFRSGLLGHEESRKVLLSRSFEAEIRNSVYRTGSYAVLAIEPTPRQSMLDAVRKRFAGHSPSAICVNTPNWRPFVRLLTETEFPNVPVLARQELDNGVTIAGTIELDAGDLGGAAPFANVSLQRRASKVAWDDDAMEREDISLTVLQSPEDNTEPLDRLREALKGQRDRLYDELGIVLPKPHVEIDGRLASDGYHIRINESDYAVHQGERANEVFINDVKTLRPLATQEPLLVWTLGYLIRRNAAQFQTVGITKFMLDFLAISFPALIEAARKRFADRQICRILRLLLDEQISIRDLRGLLECVLALNDTIDVDVDRYIVFSPHADNLYLVNGEAGGDRLSPIHYAEFVRSCRKRYISYEYATSAGASTLPVYLLDQELEGDIRWKSEGWSEAQRKSFVEEVRKEISAPGRPVLLTNVDIRRTVSNLLGKDIPDLAVLSYNELAPDLSIRPIVRITTKPLAEGRLYVAGSA